MLTHLEKAPFPYFGGKTHAAPIVWSALGDVHHYVEPFAGSLAVMLLRPHQCNRTYYSETVNDADGLLCNAWRSIALSPDATADAASWPVCEADLMARHLTIVRWREEHSLERLMADPAWHDPVIAGWWIWGTCCWIGAGWCAGTGPWCVNDDGIIVKQARGAREPGVHRKLPHLSNDGKGVNRPQAREPGVKRKLPRVGSGGVGVNRPQAREPGVKRQLPHLSNNGQGVNHAGAREPGVGDYHPMTMPEIRRWFQFLSARLRHVRVANGDWSRVCTHGAIHTLPVRGKGFAGVFLDPPYLQSERDLVYSHESNVSPAVREWCIANDGDPKVRIVLAGFSGEGHEVLVERGWREVEWFKKGFIRGGMGNLAGSEKHQQKRERLWLSPTCLVDDSSYTQLGLGG